MGNNLPLRHVSCDHTVRRYDTWHEDIKTKEKDLDERIRQTEAKRDLIEWQENRPVSVVKFV